MDKPTSTCLVDFFLRIGLAITLLYAAIAQMLYPEQWVVWLPQWLGKIASLTVLLYLFSIYEIVLGLWLLTDKKTFHAASLAALTMTMIIIFNLSALDLVFRDVAILFAALALAALHHKNCPTTETKKAIAGKRR